MRELERSIREKLSLTVAPVTSNEEVCANEKEVIRLAHAFQRKERLEKDRKALMRYFGRLIDNFALGKEIDPQQIKPQLIKVNASDETGRLFRLASTLWSVPVSPGYGRRIRYLVKDQHNDKLIGIFALGDPVIGLAARDKWIGWDTATKNMRLSSVLDAFVCGAIPPYSQLLGGKLVASLLGSKEVVLEFNRKYGHVPSEYSLLKNGEEGIISKKPRLALITVTSALGRSSIYNRLHLPGVIELIKLGSSTKGYGHFHISEELFLEMREYLRLRGHEYSDNHKYGDGPNWRMRVIRAAIDSLGIQEDILNHGILREVFAMPLADNWREYLTGLTKRCCISRPSAAFIGRAVLNRWMIPRAQRMPNWVDWSASDRKAMFEPFLRNAQIPML
jgi:hypothetical protein